MNLLELFDKVEQDRSTSVNDRVLIIDGLNSFIRTFVTSPSLSDSGEHVGGVLGMLRSIALNIRDFNPSRCIITFDGKGGSLRRKKLFPEYKQNRSSGGGFRTDLFESIEEEKESMRKQMIRAVKYFEHLPVQMLCLDNIEADDVIAYLTMQYFSTKNSKVRIVSTDRDFLQLVSENVEVWSPVKKKLYTPDVMLDEFKLHHNNYLIYRALTGDHSDNIPGVKGIGLTTLLKAYPELLLEESTVESIIISAQIRKGAKSKKIYQNIVDNQDLIERNYQLMQLQDTDISLYSKQRIIDVVEQPIPKMNRYEIKKMISEDYLQNSFKNLDSWLDQSFSSLNIWACKTL